MPDVMTVRRRTVEHPFGTLKAWMGHTHFLTRGLLKVSTEMSLCVLAYNLKRMISMVGVTPLTRDLAFCQKQGRRDDASMALHCVAI
jgi:hypothetical protein